MKTQSVQRFFDSVFEHVHARPVLTLVLLTVFGGVIRFTMLGSPCLWYDESMVYWRTCGTYGQLLDCLRIDGFVPLHYELDWFIGHPLQLDPFVVQRILIAEILICLVAIAIRTAAGMRRRVSPVSEILLEWPSVIYAALCVCFAILIGVNRHFADPPFLQWKHTVRLVPIVPLPFILRLIPALCGTLMVPAMYFLARQFFSVKISLLAAAFSACSAFLIFYSRDAKMYMDGWLFVTLATACLLWWFRTEHSTPWLCWIASGAVACGLQPSSLAAVGIWLVFLFTQQKLRWQKALLWLMGVALITAGPVGYYEKFNVWKDRVDDDWHESGLEWVSIYNHGRTGPELVRFLGTSYLIGWEWPRDVNRVQIPKARVITPIVLNGMLVSLLIVAAFPWPMRWRSIDAAIANHPQPRWRAVLWISLWLVLPVYGFYCRSMTGFESPVDWGDHLLDLLPAPLRMYFDGHLWLRIFAGLCMLSAIAVSAWYRRSRTYLLRGLEIFAICLIVLAGCFGVYAACVPMARAAMEAGHPWQSLWVPRYIGVVWPALALAVAALVMRLPTRTLRAIAIVLLLGVNLFYGCTRFLTQTEPPTDKMAADAFLAENPANHTLTWAFMPRGWVAPGGGNLFSEPAEYYLQILRQQPTTPRQFKSSYSKRYLLSRLQASFPRARNITPDLTRIIVWDQFDPSDSNIPADPTPAGWQLRSDAWYTVRDFWIWKDMSRYRRREYARTPS